MFSNYLKIAFRNLVKNKGYAFINTAGLSVGMGICLFLVLITQYALNYDKVHENSDRIYRLADVIKQENGQILDVAITPSPWGQAMAENFEEIEASVRFLGAGAAVRYGEVAMRQGVTYVDAPVFDVFTYPFKFGNPQGALERPNTIVLTEEMSDRFFDEQNPVGEILLLDDVPYEITGVLQKRNPSYSWYFNSLASFSSVTEDKYADLNNWTSHNLYTYLLLQEDADIDALESKFNDFIATNVGENFASRYFPHLQNLESIFLYSDLFAEHGETLELSYIYIFGALGLLILLIACINFINLATAQGLKRAKEVGVRKVMGAFKGQLIFQFLAEAFILATVGVLISLVFVELALPWFNALTEWEVNTNYINNYFYIFAVLFIVVFVGFLAGGYPAFILSSYTPSAVLKGDNAPKSGSSILKTSLVVTQFTVAIFMIISTISVSDQIDYLKNKNLGFNQHDLVVAGIPSDIGLNDHQTLRNELSRITGVKEVSMMSNIPGGSAGSRMNYYPEGESPESGRIMNTYFVDEYFISQFELNLLSGRDFSSEFAFDTSQSVIINQSAARALGFDNPIGKTLHRQFMDIESESFTIIGLVEDFHFDDLRESINPLVIRNNPSSFGNLTIRFQTADLEGTIVQLEETLSSLNEGLPVWYYFLEDAIVTEYDTEEIIGEMLTYFTYLTILIACLGLLGLVSFTIINKQKEIGIRKVLGASVQNIVQNISFQFIKLVLIGFLIGSPLAYFLIQMWLDSFAYSNAPGFFTFLFAGLSIFGITLFTIGYQTIRAALTNPVESLKSE